MDLPNCSSLEKMTVQTNKLPVRSTTNSSQCVTKQLHISIVTPGVINAKSPGTPGDNTSYRSKYINAYLTILVRMTFY